jgi:hypothetical protein
LNSSTTPRSTPEGVRSVSGAPNLPAGFTDAFTSRYIEAGELSLRAVIGGEGMPSNWKHLSQIPLFSNLSERRLRKLASKATEDAYETETSS